MTALATIAESLATHKETLVRNYEQAKKELEDFNKSLESRYSDTAKELLKLKCVRKWIGIKIV